MRHTLQNYHWATGLLVLLCLLSGPVAYAQQKVQVVTRTLEQRWVCKPNTPVRIRAEKATLRVQGWDKPIVQVVLRLSARHPDRAVAERDLAAAQYRLQQNVSAINLVNFFSLPARAPAVQSDLRAEYTVMMPARNSLQAANTYGQTTLIALSGEQKLEQSFGQISLSDLRGSLEVTTRYTDLVAINVQADFICEANKSAVQLLGLGGSCFVRNYYGSVQVQPAVALRKLTVEADRTKVIISATEPALFAYQLNVLQGQLMVPPAYAAIKKGTTSRASLITKPASGTQPVVRASTSYSSLTLQTQLLSTQF